MPYFFAVYNLNLDYCAHALVIPGKTLVHTNERERKSKINFLFCFTVKRVFVCFFVLLAWRISEREPHSNRWRVGAANQNPRRCDTPPAHGLVDFWIYINRQLRLHKNPDGTPSSRNIREFPPS